MKAFVIYVPDHAESRVYKMETIKSCEGMGFDAVSFEGATQHTVKDWIEEYPFLQKDKPYSRIECFRAESDKVYLTKKACLANQVRLWHKCVELNETIVCLEHDARCLREWDNPEFDEFLILNPKSGSHQECFSHVKKVEFNEGVHTYRNFLEYKFNNDWKGAWIPPGLASYAITPQGARRLIDTVKTHGCEQGDMTVNSYNVRLQCAAPDYFSVDDNLSMSKGF